MAFIRRGRGRVQGVEGEENVCALREGAGAEGEAHVVVCLLARVFSGRRRVGEAEHRQLNAYGVALLSQIESRAQCSSMCRSFEHESICFS